MLLFVTVIFITTIFTMSFIYHYFRRHCDAAVLSYQSNRMPEQIRLKVGGISSAQFSVYDEFARNIPGFQPMSERDAALLLQKSTVSVSFRLHFLIC